MDLDQSVIIPSIANGQNVTTARQDLSLLDYAMHSAEKAGGVVEYAILLSQFHHRLNQLSSTPHAFPTTTGLLLLNLNRPQRDLCSNLS